MSDFKCDICRDGKTIDLPRHTDLTMVEDVDMAAVRPDVMTQTFDCPKCVPSVPYKRVRATNVMTAYNAEEYAKFATPIERQLAARMGEYLYREGLLRFTTSGSKDFGNMEKKITVVASLGVVSRSDVERAGVVQEVATTAAPKIPGKLARQEAERRARKKAGLTTAVPWSPPPWADKPDDDITDEFDEPKDALGNRFAGLDFG